LVSFLAREAPVSLGTGTPWWSYHRVTLSAGGSIDSGDSGTALLAGLPRWPREAVVSHCPGVPGAPCHSSLPLETLWSFRARLALASHFTRITRALGAVVSFGAIPTVYSRFTGLPRVPQLSLISGGPRIAPGSELTVSGNALGAGGAHEPAGSGGPVLSRGSISAGSARESDALVSLLSGQS